MPRVTRVAKCQKDQGRCGKCGKELTKGSPYKWAKFRRGAKMKRCGECEFTRSDLTSSHHLAGLYSLVDDADFQLESLGAIAEAARDLANSVREDCAGGYRESYENMEQAFPNGCPTMEMCEENAEMLEGFADEIEQAGDEVDQLEENQDTDPVDCEHCDGNGYIEDTHTCDDCEGDGELTYMGETDPRQCDGCDGTGEVEEQDDCPECGGSGHQDPSEDVDAHDQLLEDAREIVQAAVENCPL
jgi:hypothetical protein